MYEIITHDNNQIEIRETFKKPIVYLDHWALNDISLDKTLRNNFVDLMNEKGGTFRLSIFNMVELSKQSNSLQIDFIFLMIKDIPDCGLINIDPIAVIDKENQLILDPNSIHVVQNPSAELDVVIAFLIAHNYPRNWHIYDVFRNVIPEMTLKASYHNKPKFIQNMNRLIKKARGNKDYLKRSEKRFKNNQASGPKYQRPTREILSMVFDFIIRNNQMSMSKYSEWIDLYHLIVPVSYCDVIMVDKRWKSFISQTNFSYPEIAMVFDKRSINDFFSTLETWKGTQNNYI